ncbi:MAG: undecaprenyl-diphosphate phosphatase [Proteobacteria bacterium]|nr:undecaprenyl-diphosphate phosphatase [Pseudomonadota bacterium]
MQTIWIIILGAVQGMTEFLPVSSSGHLAAGQMLLADEGLGESLAEQPLTLEILLHLATLFAVAVFFRSEVLAGIKGAGRGFTSLLHGRIHKTLKEDDSVNLAMAVLVGTVPTAILGLFMRDTAGKISGSSVGLGLSFLGCAIFLLTSRWWSGGNRRLSPGIAFLIGIVQGIAVLPGISRSGVTIVTGLAMGLEREEAARFSFLLSMPAILGAAVLELDVKSLGADENILAYLLGGLAAFVVGLAALYFLVRLVRRGRLWFFAPYMAAVGLVLMFFF